MIILQVIPRLDTGGAERTTIEVAEALTRAGHTALVASEGGRQEGALDAAGARLFRMPLDSKTPWGLEANTARLVRLIRTEGVDLVHARSRAPAWSALRAARRTGIPFVTTYHGAYNARSGLKRFYNSVMARGDRVIANSNYIAAHVMEEHGVGPDRIAVIPRGVDIDRFARSPETVARAATLKAALGVPEDRIVGVLPARLTRWKGQTVAIEAMAALKTEGGSLPYLLFVGDDQGRADYRQELETLIARYGLDSDIGLAGHQDDMPAIYALADFALNPSTDPEAFGRTAAEASAAGLPVIAADHGGAREVVLSGKTGWRVPPGDVPALAGAISELMGLNFEAHRRMGRAGAAHVAANFTVTGLQDSTLRVYRELLK
ncbi:glycosyltransferase family 4 protein [Hyphobacterium marinum]|uniref:Glycosyltransferase family 4 protein n=1 Tax=Hyphobacterium marinum TaxID=3116574 RepID=A0ABU7LUB2_9PROT|nr:glycosyltransferase family 4 protein [Hyphobacterium sp. Y6023]MEE2565161.1 glycosyltransferase family 4 protein [Hyphobacterium sp. Y6023]